MKERPILMSAPMVRAILTCAKCGKISVSVPCEHCGSTGFEKSQTRRVMMPQPTLECLFTAGILPPTPSADAIAAQTAHPGIWAFNWPQVTRHFLSKKCPYGVPGDRLWVKETFWHCVQSTQEMIGFADGQVKLRPGNCTVMTTKPDSDHSGYGEAWKCKPSIFMPRWASRITLEVTEIRVQRLQDISEEDAKADGVVPFVTVGTERDKEWYPEGYRANYTLLWNKINAERGFGWDVNPWVWAITFRRVMA